MIRLIHLLLASAFAGVSFAATQACNNSPDLCDRAYSNVTHLGAHDSAFVRDSTTDYSDSGDQYFNATVALDAGVRLLSVQVHHENNEWHLCHTSCTLLDAGKLSTWLGAIKSWLDANPDDVVTVLIVNSDSASASDIKGEFAAAGIEKYAYTPPSTSTALTQWPSLGELIANGTRLVSFVASLDPSQNTVAPYLLDEFTFIFENSYEVSAPTNFTCTPDRPTAVKGDSRAAIDSGRLPFMNHFLYSNEAFGIQVPDSDNVTTTNAPSGKGPGNLGDAAANCSSVWGKPPTFVLVDFFDQGPAIETVDKLNGITAVGRKTLPPVDSTSKSQPNLFKGLADLTASVRQGKIPSLGNWIFVGGDWGKALGTVNL